MAIRRSRQPIPTLEDMLEEIDKAMRIKSIWIFWIPIILTSSTVLYRSIRYIRKAFQASKNALGKSETLEFFDKDTETRLIVDASPVRLEAAIVQTQKEEWLTPVAVCPRLSVSTRKQRRKL